MTSSLTILFLYHHRHSFSTNTPPPQYFRTTSLDDLGENSSVRIAWTDDDRKEMMQFAAKYQIARNVKVEDCGELFGILGVVDVAKGWSDAAIIEEAICRKARNALV